MVANNSTITSKKYKKLTLQVALNGFSFCCFDTLNPAVLSFKSIEFKNANKTIAVEDAYAKAFKDYPELSDNYDEILVLHDNNLATFVPFALFDVNFLSSYLQYNTKVFATDFFAFDAIESYQMNTVYIPYVHLNNLFVDEFGPFNSKHANTVLVSKLLEKSKNNVDKKMFVNLHPNHFEIIVVHNQKLLLYNSFDYKSPEDVIYYLLFTAEQLELNPETFQLEFLGDVAIEDPCYQIAYRYIRNVSLMDVGELQKTNTFSTAENLKHFTLFQS